MEKCITKEEVIVGKKWKNIKGDTQSKDIVLKHYDNGDLEIDGYFSGTLIEESMGDWDYEFGMKIAQKDADKFLEILRSVDDPTKIYVIEKLCEEESIETNFWSWA